ncbi:DUF4221 family protein [Algoriphagus sp. CAU 1675]|uniref:DUF4221 family protein n=1 Tax=Algoriphagus sp. CAU 1675 TaxID=3032597 RepID=UPI0023DC0D6C|nr:DUF4221 family protein [Algoriphagus sp. CAU 1675]MDF2157297.1 DUF4221 family protein [Algoriphagus sp. CAU 1675]
MRKTFLYTLFALIVLTSCKSEKGKAGIGFESNLVLADSLILHLDEKSTSEFNYHQISEFAKNESFLNLNLVNQSLDFYSLETGKLIYRIPLNSHGPEVVPNLGGFFFHNKDSIFILPKMSLFNTTLIDLNGNFSKGYSPISHEDQLVPGLINHFSNSANPTYFIKNSLYFDQGILKNTAAPGVLAENYRLSGRFNLDTDSVFLFPKSGFPHFYQDKTFPIYLSVSSRILDSELQWIYSWNALDSILIFDLEMENKKSFYSKSKYRDQNFPSIANAGPSESLELIISNTHYCKIIHDPYRKRYLRFVQLGRNFDPYTDNSISSVFKNDFSIMIYNENWELQDEYFFNGNIYNLYHSFIGKKGLYMPKTNPFYTSLDEDNVVFDIFEIK